MRYFVGQTATLTRQFSQADYNQFAALSGDDNPIHVDPAFTSQTRFGGTVAHGMLLYACLSGLMHQLLPGPLTRQHQQQFVFPAPTYTAQEYSLQVQITALPSPTTFQLATQVRSTEGELTADGSSLCHLLTDPPTAPEPLPQEPSEGQTLRGQTLRGLTLGQTDRLTRTFTLPELEQYADLTGDYAPLTSGPQPWLPGALLGSLFSALLGTQLPGPGTNWLKQQLSFHQPVLLNQSLTAEVEIVRLRPVKQLVNLQGKIYADGQLVCTGHSLMLVVEAPLTDL